ncbi:MAG: polysaccharide lyase beta-sandwich domain-containing protein [Mediterranea sp.]|nr:polysaccharide lyase beta-sandwich domain-containing protein [Mediterranea sp.]
MHIKQIKTQPHHLPFFSNILLRILLLLTAAPLTASVRQPDVYHILMENIRKEHLSHEENTAEETARWLERMDGKGAFDDIDYTSRAQTSWRPVQHLDRIYTWVKAYLRSQNYKDSPELRQAIILALNYWYETHPVSTNWYMQQIACPQRMGVILILMRSSTEGLPAELERKLIGRMADEGGRPDQKGSQGTAANKLSIATHWIYRGCLMQDEETLSFGVRQAYQPLQPGSGEGIQYDYSYQQHGKQLYIGGYGTEIADLLSKLALYTRHTPYALPEEKLNLLGRFVRNAYIPAIRGRYFLYNVLGRGLSRENALDQTRFIPVLQRMTLLDPGHAPVYQESISRISQTKPAGHGLEPLHIHFPHSDYTLHQRLAYTFDVRMASIHTCRNENGNGENLKGFFLTDGATAIVKEGNEYENIFPVWDWSSIPGTTTPAIDPIPVPGQWEKPGTSTYAGGVSDGKYGVSAYTMDEKQFGINTAARKAWFMFDDEIVCLGAGICSTSPYKINTTVNQCLLQGEVFISADGDARRLDRGKHRFDRLLWVKHQGIGYFFDAADVHIENMEKRGDWKTINSSYAGKPVTKDVLTIRIEHGEKPSGAGYAYIIVPTQPASGQIKYPSDKIEIRQNTPDVQAVEHTGLHLLGIVFHRPGTFTCNRFSLEADAGCILLLSETNREDIKVSIADPTRSQATIKLKAHIFGTGRKEYTFTLPVYPDPYAGSTHTYIINKESLTIRKPQE